MKMSDFSYETVRSTPGENGVRVIALEPAGQPERDEPPVDRGCGAGVDDANADPDTRAIVFTGTGTAFCAGDDRREHVHPETESRRATL